MQPQEFVQALQQAGQLQALVGEVARNKAIAVALGKVKVVDAAGKPVDLSSVIGDAEDEAEEKADEKPAAEKAPAKKAPAKKPAAKKDAAADEKKAEKKPAAKKPAAKKAPAKKA